jgi:hypothetical protein
MRRIPSLRQDVAPERFQVQSPLIRVKHCRHQCEGCLAHARMKRRDFQQNRFQAGMVAITLAFTFLVVSCSYVSLLNQGR